MLARHTGPGKYFPSVDGLRAIAVVTVMIFHLLPAAMPGGFIGVDAFFVISGFVVTRSMLRDLDQPILSFLSAFYSRRFRRIVPALFVCLAITVLISEAVVPSAWLSQTMQKTGRAAFVGASNFVLAFQDDGYFATRSAYNPFTHTWSLAVEEQFYLLFPLLLFSFSKIMGERGSLRVSLAVSAMALFSLIYCAFVSRIQPSVAYYMLPSRFWELGTGSALALSYQRFAAPRKAVSEGLALIGMLLIVVSLCFAREDAFPFPWAIPVVLGSAILIFLSASESSSIILRMLASRPFVFVGLLSYSLYLWHWPVYTLMRWTCGLNTPQTYIIALALTALLAFLSYRFVEQSFHKSRLVGTLSNRRTVGAGLVTSVLGVMFAIGVHAFPAVFSFTTVQRHHRDWYPDFITDDPDTGNCRVEVQNAGAGHTALIPHDCRRRAPAGRLYVVGDSHADAYHRMLQLYAAQTGVRIDIFAMGGCPWAPVFEDSSAQSVACTAFKKTVLEQLTTTSPPHSTVFLASLRVPRLSDQFGLDEKQTADLTTYLRAREMPGMDEAKSLIRTLGQAGLTVIVDLPKPVFQAPPYRCSDWFNRENPICSAGLSVPRTKMLAYRQPVVAALRSLGSPGQVIIWDPFPVLCPPAASCDAARDGRPLFFDGDHLSGYSNTLLLDSFTKALSLGADFGHNQAVSSPLS